MPTIFYRKYYITIYYKCIVFFAIFINFFAKKYRITKKAFRKAAGFTERYLVYRFSAQHNIVCSAVQRDSGDTFAVFRHGFWHFIFYFRIYLRAVQADFQSDRE